MRIAMIHFRVGATDGVSLEMHKWKTILEQLGHKVFYIAAEKNQEESFLIPEMSITSPMHQKLFKNCYTQLVDYRNEDELKQAINDIAATIETKLLDIIDRFDIELIIPNNVLSLGLHIPTGLAIAHVIQNRNIKVIFHHHDFYWERERYSHPTAPFIQHCLDTYFPFHNNRTQHCVINKIAQNELRERKQIDAYVVPNVFDFDQKEWNLSSYTLELKKLLSISAEDLVILQATRIEDRKAIELSLDLTHSLFLKKETFIGGKLYDGRVFKETSNIHFIIAGLNEIRPDLFKVLKSKIDLMPYQVHLIHDMIGAKRSNHPKLFSLWDAYTLADAITYPSILEGWGNQLLEGLFAKKPIVIFEYPVYLTDIKQFGFDLITLGSTYNIGEDKLVHIDKEMIDAASNELINTLFSSKIYRETTEKNYAIAHKNLSLQALKAYIKHIIENI